MKTRPAPAQAAFGSRPIAGPAQLTEAQYAWEERAAILEFCAGYPRREAEQLAREQIDDSRRRAAMQWRQETLWNERTSDRR